MPVCLHSSCGFEVEDLSKRGADSVHAAARVLFDRETEVIVVDSGEVSVAVVVTAVTAVIAVDAAVAIVVDAEIAAGV